jgi:hypothetical protein
MRVSKPDMWLSHQVLDLDTIPFLIDNGGGSN